MKKLLLQPVAILAHLEGVMRMTKWRITTTFLVRIFTKNTKFLNIFFPQVLLVNGPVNSTQVESSTASSHPNIELSRIGGPDRGDVAGDHGVGDFELSRIGGPDPGDVAGDHGVGDQEPVEGGEQEHRTSLESEDMVLTGAVGGGSSSTLQGQFRCHCGKECTR